ncbi:MAG: phosphoribosylglycinamide formyltransferase [Betaproteobacteria bacterium]|nr:phosphoribosylglycinamide formyltransferase [Betaproteobacteria bacterium]
MTGIVVLISGRGSNMRSLVEHQLPVRAVLSNRADAAGLAFARDRGIPAVALDHRDFASRESFDQALAELIDRYHPEAVILAGFMRILSVGLVRRYEGRLLNIHPSLLPAFPGLDTHARALQAGVKIHGATVHYVTPELDAGPIILQAAVPVRPDDTEASLAARVLAGEHRIFPLAVQWLLDGRLSISEGVVRVAGDPPQWMFNAS